MQRVLTIFVITALLYPLLVTPSYGYIDPTTGTFFLQLLLGGVASVGILIRFHWARIKALFCGRPRTHDPCEREGATEETKVGE